MLLTIAIGTALVVSLSVAVAANRLLRQIDYLTLLLWQQYRSPGARVHSHWSDKCNHCGRRIRDEPVATLAPNSASSGGVVAVFHSTRGDCFEAYHRFVENAKVL